MISVRQAGDLPPASFRFPVTRDTLALGYILPAVGRIRDFYPLKHAPAGRTYNIPVHRLGLMHRDILMLLSPDNICNFFTGKMIFLQQLLNQCVNPRFVG